MIGSLQWIGLHGLVVMLGLVIYVAASHTLQQRRHPSAAIGWVVGLVVFPYVTLPLYLLFGNRKLFARAPQIASRTGSVADPTLSRAQQLTAALKLPPASSYEALNVHEDGKEALQALIKLIEGARSSIDLCTFILAPDSLGDDIARRLMRRAKDGVQVRVLVDGLGAYLSGFPKLRRLRAAGVQTSLFVPPLRSTLLGRTNLRNHRKMVIADGAWLWSGGRNLAAEYFEGSPGKAPWLDLSFDLRGALVGQAQQRFAQDWAFATQGTRDDAAPAPEALPQQRAPMAQLVPSGPDQADDTIYTLLVSGFFTARRRILAVTPYFVPDPTLLMSLQLAARRGIDVDLVMPAHSNHLLADMARHRSLRDLTAAGAHVWFLERMIHAKAVVIDDDLALAGSANLDQRSLLLNYEMMVAFYDTADVQRFARWVEGQRAAAAPYRGKRASLIREVAEGLLLWLAFQL